MYTHTQVSSTAYVSDAPSRPTEAATCATQNKTPNTRYYNICCSVPNVMHFTIITIRQFDIEANRSSHVCNPEQLCSGDRRELIAIYNYKDFIVIGI